MSRTATPRAVPTCAAVLTAPAAMPCWSLSSAAVAALTSPRPRTGPRRPRPPRRPSAAPIERLPPRPVHPSRSRPHPTRQVCDDAVGTLPQQILPHPHTEITTLPGPAPGLPGAAEACPVGRHQDPAGSCTPNAWRSTSTPSPSARRVAEPRQRHQPVPRAARHDLATGVRARGTGNRPGEAGCIIERLPLERDHAAAATFT